MIKLHFFNFTWLVLFFVAVPCMAAERGFSHFGQWQRLQAIPDTTAEWRFYRVQAGTLKGAELAIASRLVVSTSVQSEQLNTLPLEVDGVKMVRSLGKFAQQEFWLLDLREVNIWYETMQAVQAVPIVNYVLPDILQLKPPSISSLSGGRNNNQQNSDKQADAVNKAWSYSDLSAFFSKYRQQNQFQNRASKLNLTLIDDGFDFASPELNHIKPVFSYDSEYGQLDARPRTELDQHGSKIAEVIVGKADLAHVPEYGLTNNINVTAIRQVKNWISHSLVSLNVAQLNQADVINCSWNSFWIIQPIAEAITALSQTGRSGLGTAVVVAAGNANQQLMANSTEAGLHSAIVIGASDKLYPIVRSAPYSNWGDTVDFYLPGAADVIAAGRLTTDIVLENPTETQALSVGTRISGTSYAAAYASGMFLLLMAKHPRFSLEDIMQLMEEQLGSN